MPSRQFGLQTALLMQLTLVGAGLGALLVASEAAFLAVKLAGAAYLVWLGIQKWRATPDSGGVSSGGESPRGFYVQGLLVNLGNPKAIVFIAALVPPFIDRATAPAPVCDRRSNDVQCRYRGDVGLCAAGGALVGPCPRTGGGAVVEPDLRRHLRCRWFGAGCRIAVTKHVSSGPPSVRRDPPRSNPVRLPRAPPSRSSPELFRC